MATPTKDGTMFPTPVKIILNVVFGVVATGVYARAVSWTNSGSPVKTMAQDCLAVLTIALCFGFVVSTKFVRPPWFVVRQRQRLDADNVAPYWRHVNNPKDDLGFPYEDIEFRSTVDNKLLRGWFVPASCSVAHPHIEDSKQVPVVVLVHGGGRDRRAHLRHLPFYRRLGYDCVLFDLREHGASEVTDGKLRYGETEHRDVEGVVQYLESEGRKSIILVGTSMGASSCIFAAARDSQGAVKALVAENPVANPGWLADNVLPRVFRSMLLPFLYQYSWLLRVVLMAATSVALLLRTGWITRCIMGKDRDALSVADRVRCPTLILHSNDDQIVGVRHGIAIYDRLTCQKDLWIVSKTLHCRLYDDHPEEYEKQIGELLQTVATNG